MGTLARVQLTSSTVRLGGGMYGRLLRMAVREHANSRQTNRLLLEALVAAKLESIPSDVMSFQVFMYGPMCAVLEPALGQHVVDAVVAKVESLLVSSEKAMSGIQPIPSLNVIVATRDDLIADELLSTFHGARRAKDFFSLLEAVEAQEDVGANILLDGALPGYSKATGATLARVLPPRARVVQWGGSHPSDAVLSSIQWDCLPAPPEISLHEISKTLVRAQEVPLVLIVDDSEAWRTVLTRMMTSEGYDVACAHNGFTALAASVSHRPSIVLSDYEMPVINGGQLAQMLTERLGDDAPPVVLVSSREIGHPIPGVCRTILKSHARDELLPLIAELLIESP